MESVRRISIAALVVSVVTLALVLMMFIGESGESALVAVGLDLETLEKDRPTKCDIIYSITWGDSEILLQEPVLQKSALENNCAFK